MHVSISYITHLGSKEMCCVRDVFFVYCQRTHILQHTKSCCWLCVQRRTCDEEDPQRPYMVCVCVRSHTLCIWYEFDYPKMTVSVKIWLCNVFCHVHKIPTYIVDGGCCGERRGGYRRTVRLDVNKQAFRLKGVAWKCVQNVIEQIGWKLAKCGDWKMWLTLSYL